MRQQLLMDFRQKLTCLWTICESLFFVMLVRDFVDLACHETLKDVTLHQSFNDRFP